MLAIGFGRDVMMQESEGGVFNMRRMENGESLMTTLR